MKDRRTTLLVDLLELRRPLPAILGDLSTLPWDCDELLVTLGPEHVVTVLQRYLSGEISSADVEDWADAVELRDGISADPDDPAAQAIHELANPLITRPLSMHSASTLVASLTGLQPN